MYLDFNSMIKSLLLAEGYGLFHTGKYKKQLIVRCREMDCFTRVNIKTTNSAWSWNGLFHTGKYKQQLIVRGREMDCFTRVNIKNN